MNNTSRRNFLKTGAAAALLPLLTRTAFGASENDKAVLRPDALRPGNVIGLITPASPSFEGNRSKIEAKLNLESLGFNVKFAKNILKKRGYLAGTVQERISDIHEMFADPEVKAIMAIRGGYGSAQLLPHLDYKLIKKNPKIFVGYSDVTSLLLGIHKKTDLVTFHGPMATSTFTDYTKKYFLDTLGKTEPVGLINSAQFSSGANPIDLVWSYNKGVGEGRLIGGNSTLLQTTIGTPYEFNTDEAILFIEEIGEEPYDLDRMLHHFKQAGKFDKCRGVFFDRLDSAKPANYEPAFNSTLSVEEIIEDVFKDFDFPVCVGFSIGHIKDKPTLPLGIKTRLDADKGKIFLLEAAVK